MVIFNKNEIFTLWVKNPPTNIQIRCWKSWLNLGYNVSIFCDDILLLPVEIVSRCKILSPHLNSFPSFTFNEENLLQCADLWRFIQLKELGGTWVDSDLYLLKRLPEDDIIISSEFTPQAGGRKCKNPLRPNIGVLRFPPNDPFLVDVVKKLLPTTKADLSTNANQTSKMYKFIKLLNSEKWQKYNEFVATPDVYCPIPYSFAKEIYEKDWMSDFKPKYGLDFYNKTEKTRGIHLWANIVRNKLINIHGHTESFYNHHLP